MLLSFFVVGNTMLTVNGALCILNMFVFIIFATVFALFLGNLISDKNAISGIINVVALGSSFLCGAFIPVSWLPDGVVSFAHIFPSYYYINSNELAVNIESLSLETISPILVNYAILFVFTIIFIILTNIVTSKKRILH